MYCKSCGSMIQPSMKTCPRCGAPNVTSGGNGFRLERPDAAPGGGQPPAQSPETVTRACPHSSSQSRAARASLTVPGP